jgi:hypothetical protein
MHLLYVDDSGSVHNLDDPLFVLAGFSIFERQTYWLERQLDGIAARFDAEASRRIEQHGSAMRNGRGVWRASPKADRIRANLFAAIAPRFYSEGNRVLGLRVLPEGAFDGEAGRTEASIPVKSLVNAARTAPHVPVRTKLFQYQTPQAPTRAE